MATAVALGARNNRTAIAEEAATESGQVLIHRRASWQTWHALKLAWVLNAHPVTYNLLHGDKDTYRLAWQSAGVRFCQVEPRPQALGGHKLQMMVGNEYAVPHSYRPKAGFCGQALVQRAPDGSPLFLHRVLAKYNLQNLLSLDSWSEVRTIALWSWCLGPGFSLTSCLCLAGGAVDTGRQGRPTEAGWVVHVR